MSNHNDDDEALERKILKLAAAAYDRGDNALELQELVAATGASPERVEAALEQLCAKGYMRFEVWARH